MITEAIVLAGGLGTRLRGVIKDIPKPMALVNDKPFLEYLFNYLKKHGIERIVLSVGYKYEIIEDYFGKSFNGIEIVYAVEKVPLGTGGGIANAMNYISNKEVFLLNGDSYFDVDLKKLYDFHSKKKSDLTLSLKKMSEFDRYGTVKMENYRITEFVAKQYQKTGLINAGVYVIKKDLLKQDGLGEKFSFEKDLMEQYTNKYNFFGFVSNDYFIDIGIPEDYAKAQNDFLTF